MEKEMPVATDPRQLADLISIGPAMLRDFDLLGIRSVKELARRNPFTMYSTLNRMKGQRQDICCLDVYRAAVAQARDPLLPPEKSQWWYWSRLRKANNGKK
jgi:pathogenicity locus Cdd1 protein